MVKLLLTQAKLACLFKAHLLTMMEDFNFENSKGNNIQAYLVLLRLALLHIADVAFLQVKGKTLHQQKDYDSLKA